MFNLVRMKGLEPSRPKALAPKRADSVALRLIELENIHN